jgi:hypothetical protein
MRKFRALNEIRQLVEEIVFVQLNGLEGRKEKRRMN